jgi:hypothetical protein
MSPAQKKMQKRGKKKGGRGPPSSSDRSVAAGRGGAIPRRGIGHDTLLGLAQSQRRTLVYVNTYGTSTGAGGVYNELPFTLNGLFNPQGGFAAVGFAKYMAFYSKAFVLGARMKITGVVVPVAGFTSTVVVGVTISTNGTAFTGMATAISNGMCDYHVTNTNPDRYVLNGAVDVSKFLNKPKVLDDPQLFSTVAANPTQVIVAHIWIQNFNAAIATTNIVVEIEFDAVFTDPIPFI